MLADEEFMEAHEKRYKAVEAMLKYSKLQDYYRIRIAKFIESSSDIKTRLRLEIKKV